MTPLHGDSIDLFFDMIPGQPTAKHCGKGVSFPKGAAGELCALDGGDKSCGGLPA